MAKRTVTILTDDLDGTESDDVAAVQFSWDGKAYTIDLTSRNAEKFEKVLRPYLDAGTRVSGAASRSAAPSRRGSGRGDLDDVRSWASANGYSVGERGRIKAEILQAYDAAH